MGFFVYLPLKIFKYSPIYGEDICDKEDLKIKLFFDTYQITYIIPKLPTILYFKSKHLN